MSQFASIQTSDAAPTRQGAVANRNLLIAAILLGAAVVLIGAQLIFAGNHLDMVHATADAAALGIIGP